MRLFSPNNIQVLSVKAYYDDKTYTKTKESPNLLQYESQHFRCKVKLALTPSEADRPWSIGLIQACDYMYLENRYGDIGSSFWEFHPIKYDHYQMVNDSDGRQYPFYSLSNSKYEVNRGRVYETPIALHYEDHFYPTVAWELPYCQDAQLTDIIRKQDFWVWLVAISRSPNEITSQSNEINFNVDKVHVLKTIRWRYNLHMKFSPNENVGQRLDSVQDRQDSLPVILDMYNMPPVSSLFPPHCNAAQSLIWYPKSINSTPKLLVPPKQIIVPWDDWVTDMLPDTVNKIPKPKDCKIMENKLKNQTEDPFLSNKTGSSSSSNCIANFLNRQQVRMRSHS